MPSVCFSHLHFYCDRLRPVEEYKQLERKLNDFASRDLQKDGNGFDVGLGREAWLQLREAHGDPINSVEPKDYKSSGQDVVEQILVGLGWRVTAASDEELATRTLLLTSEDQNGVKLLITAHKEHSLEELSKTEPDSKRQRVDQRFDHFDTEHLARFASYHNGRQGIAVLGFAAPRGSLKAIFSKYQKLHPKLLLGGIRSYGSTKILEVFAYYVGEVRSSDADVGTLLRFVESQDTAQLLPGVKHVEAQFDGISQSAYCDHWVSNVFSRTGFLETLEETLGFTPKVDFNAGVVAAGEAQIESTVTGNSPDMSLDSKTAALKDQSQIYLPINNALSEVGHVHVFLRELGQGIQHVASRVSDLGALIQRANDYRKMTGAGLSFLQIPMSYYGYLTSKRLAQETGLDEATAEKCILALKKAGIVDCKNIVALDATREAVAKALEGLAEGLEEHVLRARYGNLHMLLRDHLDEEAYLRIVRNNILVDIQGDDLLLQIFTAKVLQRKEGEEAPFLEFIQRVCSQCTDEKGCPKKIKPGCGGFGIRNFLTLFLSIEVSKASAARADAEKRGDAKAANFQSQRVDAFTEQLDESNPILTAISDAMTAEGLALERGDHQEALRYSQQKAKGNQALQNVSTKYKNIMKQIRELEASQ